MAVIAYREALNQAMSEEMDRDDRVFLMGEEVAEYDGAYKVSQGMLARFGPRRIIDTPISEEGLRRHGHRRGDGRPPPHRRVHDLQLQPRGDRPDRQQRRQHALHVGRPVRRADRVPGQSSGMAGCLAATHSHRLEAWYAHIPGLTVVMPATPADAKGMLKSAIRSDDPVIFIEHEVLYGDKGEVPDGPDHLVPIGKAEIKRAGSDVTLITYSRSLKATMAAAETSGRRRGWTPRSSTSGRSARSTSIRSWNRSRKTHRAVIVEEDWPYCGLGAGISDRIMQKAFDELDAPIRRVTTKDAPIPYNRALEASMLPSVDRVVAQVRDVMYSKPLIGLLG